MGISIAETAVTNCISSISEMNFRLSCISATFQSMSNASSVEMQRLDSLEACENQYIECQLEPYLSDPSVEGYTELLQNLKAAKDEIAKKYERLDERAQKEYERKEKQLTLQQEQIEIQLEAMNANKEAYQELLNKNIEEDFSYS